MELTEYQSRLRAMAGYLENLAEDDSLAQRYEDGRLSTENMESALRSAVAEAREHSDSEWTGY